LEPDDPFQYLLTLNNLIVNKPDMYILIEAMIVVLLLICSAFISGSEVAFFSLSPTDRETFRHNKSKKAGRVLRLLSAPDRLLSTILVVNNFVNIGIVILSAYISSQIFDFSNKPAMGFILEVVVITFLLLLFGEIIPKVYATRRNVKFAGLMAGPLIILDRVFRPVSIVLMKLSSLFKRAPHDSPISMDELSDAITIASGENIEDEKILKGIIKFGNIDAREIMKPRIDVVAIDIKTPFKNVIPDIIESGYSRIPVYAESFDNIQGVLYIKDLLPHFHKPSSFNWQSLIRPPYYVPETKKINDLLEEFQTKKMHLAIVIDEYGGTSGIITLEDILEEIVGDIPDESDNNDISFEKLSDSEYIFEGKTQLHDFCKVLDIDDDPFEDVRGESDTLAGLILELAGEIPDKGFSINHKNFRFEIHSADSRRIKKLRVRLLNRKDEKNI
jgi:putative hemolysin